MKLIIAGGRDFNDKQRMWDELKKLHSQGVIDEQVELVTGMARGADMCGYEIFKEHNAKIHQFIPDWNSLGKSAGFIRNAEMGAFADAALIFWDGQSKGTKHMIEYMARHRKPMYIIRY